MSESIHATVLDEQIDGAQPEMIDEWQHEPISIVKRTLAAGLVVGGLLVGLDACSGQNPLPDSVQGMVISHDAHSDTATLGSCSKNKVGAYTNSESDFHRNGLAKVRAFSKTFGCEKTLRGVGSKDTCNSPSISFVKSLTVGVVVVKTSWQDMKHNYKQVCAWKAE